MLWGRIPRGNGGRVAAVLLVDNAAQPMQAAPVAALKGIASRVHRMNLSLAVMEAAKTFHTRWRGILGLDYNRDAPKLHCGGRHPRLGMAV